MTKITFKIAEKVVELEKSLKHKARIEKKILRKLDVLLSSNQDSGHNIEDPGPNSGAKEYPSPPPTPGATANKDDNEEETLNAIDALCKELKEGNDNEDGEQTLASSQQVNSEFSFGQV